MRYRFEYRLIMSLLSLIGLTLSEVWSEIMNGKLRIVVENGKVVIDRKDPKWSFHQTISLPNLSQLPVNK